MGEEPFAREYALSARLQRFSVRHTPTSVFFHFLTEIHWFKLYPKVLLNIYTPPFIGGSCCGTGGGRTGPLRKCCSPDSEAVDKMSIRSDPASSQKRNRIIRRGSLAPFAREYALSARVQPFIVTPTPPLPNISQKWSGNRRF